MSDHFQLVSKFQPSGDQPTAIAQLKDGLEAGLAHQTSLGATGTGKTITQCATNAIAVSVASNVKPMISGASESA